MKIINAFLLAACVGLFVGAASYNWVSTKFPSCELVASGIGVSTNGCSNATGSSVAQCASETPNSPEMAACINRNYYRAKYLPFGFTQRFGDQSNLIDPKPRLMNTLAMVFLGFILALILLKPWQNFNLHSHLKSKLPSAD